MIIIPSTGTKAVYKFAYIKLNYLYGQYAIGIQYSFWVQGRSQREHRGHLLPAFSQSYDIHVSCIHHLLASKYQHQVDL